MNANRSDLDIPSPSEQRARDLFDRIGLGTPERRASELAVGALPDRPDTNRAGMFYIRLSNGTQPARVEG